jgi:hypothetical protein
MNTVAAAGAGFLLCVLWFDLMFDTQALRAPAGALPEAVLASIAGYYARVTTAARPMNRLIALVMACTLAALVVEIVRGEVSSAVAWASLVLAAGPIGLAGAVTVPSAVRLGTRRDRIERQSELARAIGRQHLVCLVGIAALLALQIASA